jgi:dihydroorotate dehydrogenase electron transfer subunit
VKSYEAKVLGRERFGDHALLRYRWAGEPPEPGQFVMARAATPIATLDPFLFRPFFAHDYADGELSLLFEVRGRGTALLAEEDAELLISTPLGQGFKVQDGGPVALVGGGVWVSPLKLLSRHLRESGIPHDVFLEVPSTAPKAYAEWIRENYPGATLVPTDGSPSSPPTVLSSVGNPARYRAVYASGPGEMLAAVKSASEGTVLAQLALRERMACANGSCYGCAVPVWEPGARMSYARACVEGPVFPAEVLAW